MKKEIIEKTIKELKEKVNDYMERKNCTLQFILSKDGNISDIIYADLYGHLILSVDPESFEITKLDKDVSIIDDVLFSRMNEGKNIEYMADEAHDYIWYIIETHYGEYNMSELDVVNKNSMLRYLKYCKENNITAFYLDKKFNSNPVDLIEFYDNSHDVFELGEFNVIMSRDVFDKRIETNYIAFALGYDLLYRMMKKYQHLDSDSNFNFCYLVADDFMNSEYYEEGRQLDCERLKKYVDANIEKITQFYINYFGASLSINVDTLPFLKEKL